MPPVIANGGYYGAPGVTAAGAYGSTPADMLYSLRNNGWSDQQIMDTYGANDPMVRIMQLENRWNQARPGAGGYRYQYPTRAAAPARRPAAQAQTQRRAAGPSMNTMAEAARSVAGMVPGGQQPAAQQPAAQQPVGAHGASPLAARLAQQRAGNAPAQAAPAQLTPGQQAAFERVVADPYQSLPTFSNFAPSYIGTADNYYAPQTGAGIRIRPWTDPITYGGSLNIPPMQDEPSLVDSSSQYGSLYMYTGPFSGPRRNDDFSASSLGQSIFNSLAQYR